MATRTIVIGPILFLVTAVLATATFEAQPRQGGITLQVRGYDYAGVRGKATLSAGPESCPLAWVGREDRPSCSVTLPPDAATVTLVGEYSA